MSYDLTPFILTFKLAFVTTAILIVLGIPLGYWLAFSRKKFRVPAEALVSMPLVLPPTVLGFYLLVAFGPHSWIGSFLDSVFNIRVVFSFSGLVIGSVIFSLPFMVNPVKSGLQSVPVSLIEASQTLGKSGKETFFRVLLPNIRPALLTGIMMSFAHTIGEFGVVLMIGGNIPDQTRVASIAIFSEVEALNFKTANFYSLTMIAISFCILLVLFCKNKKALRIFND
jgi:molybdate transport system permease protein